MSVRNLKKLFRPQRIAVVGSAGTSDPVWSAILRNLQMSEFAGEVYAVDKASPRNRALGTYCSIASLPCVVDLALICGSAADVPGLVSECGEAGVGAVVVTGGGFREAGAVGRELGRQILRESARFDGMRILGPRSMGVLVPHLHLNASLAATQPKPGRIAFISQSGTMCTSALDIAAEAEIGFSHFVSIGDALEVTVGDLIDYFAADPHTDSIILFLDSISDARQFMSAARAIAKEKPIVVYKTGRFSESAEAAISYTGSLASVDAVYEAAFERAGVVRVTEIDDMFDCAQLLARSAVRTGPRLAIVTNAGGPGIVAVDSLLSRQGQLAQLSSETLDQLSEVLPPQWSRANPVDIQGEAQPDRYERALEIVLRDDAVDAVLVILTPQAISHPTAAAKVVVQTAKRSRKPILAAWMGGPSVREGIHLLREGNVPTYTTPKNAIHAFMHLVEYTRNMETLQETPRELAADAPVDRQQQLALIESIGSLNQEVLSEMMSKSLLETYGICTARPHAAATADEAVGLARQFGFPVVLKVNSPQIIHKNEVGGVLVNLCSEEEVRGAFDRIVSSVAKHRPSVTVEGVTVQPMITAADGLELFLGSRRDPVFGPVIIVGSGGVTAELLEDFALGMPPLNERLVRRMLESLRTWPILAGYRNRPPMHLDALVQSIIQFSHLVADIPQIREFDVNPILVSPRQVIALDARADVDLKAEKPSPRRFSHLAIRPYPEELERASVLKDGTPVLLRPIKPEDEPLWHKMLADCSQESIRFRFRHLFQAMSHEMAARYCFIDYDRELAIVAEVEQNGRREFAGVVHLVCDVDHGQAEYAVLVTDRWQGQQLGTHLTQYCLEIASRWGLKKVIGETEKHNHRMLATFRRFGFELTYGTEFDDPVIAIKTVSPGGITPGKNETANSSQ
jgi:acetyltransferase